LAGSGLTPAQALAAATSVPAARFHFSDRGRIAPGLRADLLLVRGDPTQDIRAIRNVESVWRGGARFDREAYRTSLEMEVASAKGSAPSTPPGLISGFDEGGAPLASFGSGWKETTDTLAGGKSTASLALVKGGAMATRGALEVTGLVDPGLPYAWSGAIFFPGSHPLEPMDLSASKGVAFHARGDGKSYRLMVFTKRMGRMPASREFTTGPGWEEHHVSFSELGLDGTDVIGIAFCAGPEPGKFRFDVDEVALR